MEPSGRGIELEVSEHMATRRCPGVNIFGFGAPFWAGLAGVGGEVPVGGEDLMFARAESLHRAARTDALECEQSPAAACRGNTLGCFRDDEPKDMCHSQGNNSCPLVPGRHVGNDNPSADVCVAGGRDA